jgi:hypothetical protein
MEQFNQRLSSLKADLALYGDDIVAHINSLYNVTTMGSRFELKNDPFGMLGVLQVDVAELLKETQLKADFKTAHAADIDECKRLITVLSHVSQTVDKITECEALVTKMSLIAACNGLSQLKVLLDGLPSPSTELGIGKVCQVLCKEQKLLQARLRAKTVRIFKEAVQFEFGRVTVHRELKGILRAEDAIIQDPIALRDVWRALEQLEQEGSAVDLVLSSTWTYVLKPLWREKKLQAPRTSRLEEPSVSELVLDSVLREGKALESASSRTGGKKGLFTHLPTVEPTCTHECFLMMVTAWGRHTYPELGQCRMPLAQLLEGLGQVFSFLWMEVLYCNDRVTHSVCTRVL